LNWLYAYKLTNLIVPTHEITKRHFNKNQIESVIKWAK
jgi:hypothetical protein